VLLTSRAVIATTMTLFISAAETMQAGKGAADLVAKSGQAATPSGAFFLSSQEIDSSSTRSTFLKKTFVWELSPFRNLKFCRLGWNVYSWP